MTQRIMIMGLPGSGKTTLAGKVEQGLKFRGKTVTWFNADKVRKDCDDWDFSKEGRIRQSTRMSKLADECGTDFAICDFCAPLVEMREQFKPDLLVWVDTIKESRYEDTNKAFINPNNYNLRVGTQDADAWSTTICAMVVKFDTKKPTVQLLGRYQPWHPGHRALFERAIRKTGQVCILVRDCDGEDNPFTQEEVKWRINGDLDPIYKGMYEVVFVPNITNITYGRKVGYAIEQETFDSDTESISATKIRAEIKNNT